VSNTDLYSFAPDTLFRGGVKVASSGISKPSLTTSGAADHIAYKSWDGLLGVGTDISYAFRINGTSPADDTTGFSQFTALQIAATQKALTGWSDVANVHFTRVDDGNGYSNNAPSCSATSTMAKERVSPFFRVRAWRRPLRATYGSTTRSIIIRFR